MLRIKSHPNNILEIEHFVSEMMGQYDLKPDLHPNILISLTEAVTNAIRHGNNEDESKVVSVDLSKKNNKLVVRVKDEGNGFNHDDVPDPTTPENIDKLGCRGVFIMKQLGDWLRYHKNGSVVELEFNIR